MSSAKQVIKPFREQKPFLKDDKRYLGYVSGVGAGKTFSGIIRTIRNMTEWNEGEMGAIIAPTRQMIVNVIIPEMRDLGLFDAPINWEYKSAYSDEPGIHTKQGSRALILSADNKQTVERLRGLNLAWVWIDEKTAVPKRAQEIAMQRLRKGNYRNLYVTTTPKGKDDTYDFFVGDVDADKEKFGKATLYETDDRRAIVGVPTSANPHTPQDYKDAMESDLPDELAAQEVRGQFVELGMGILQKQMLDVVSPEVLDSTELTFHVGVDIGVEADAQKARDNDTDYWAASIVAHHRRLGEAYLVDVAKKRGMTLRQGVEWLKQVINGVPQPKIAIESVQAQRWFLQECRNAGLDVYGVDQRLKKENRIIQLSVPFENSTIQLVNMEQPPEEGLESRWDDFVEEWITFPEGRHDDMIDAVELAIRELDIGSTMNWEGMDMYGRDS